MNRGDLRSEVAFRVNFNENQADQDFSTTRLNKSIQYVYEKELESAKQEGGYSWFRKVDSITWPTNQVTLQLPTSIDSANILAFVDITHSNPGTRMQIRDTANEAADAYWLNSNTLQWGSVGPSETKTLQVLYMGRAEQLQDDEAVPALIPPQFHWLLVWSAAVYLRQIADEKVPQSWDQSLREWQMKYYKFLSQGRPLTNTPTISDNNSNVDNFLFY